MNKTEVIARRILGWKLNRWDRWYDSEKEVFIYDFQPEKNLEQALLIVERLKSFGYSYSVSGKHEVCFNDVCTSGDTLAQAITNAAFSLADNSTIDEGWL
ncbi:BC1872 family protein [Neobacillus niacini]|uniref:BC1872 family protein n=1 Tax=Neobacillus niacini TaxID=86668 RepID=UPI002FFF4A24